MILLSFCLYTVLAVAQANTTMPPEAILFYNKAIQHIKPDIKILMHKSALDLNHTRNDANGLLADLKQESILKKLSHSDLEGLAIIILVQATKNTDEDLKRKVMKLRKDPDQSGIEETKRIAEFKSFLAENIHQILKRSSNSLENVINSLRNH